MNPLGFIQLNDAFLLLKKILLVMAILGIFWLLTWVIQTILSKSFKRATIENTPISNFLMRVIKGIMILLGVLVALGTVGIYVSALVASIGLTGFGLSFALKDMVSSAVAGMMLMVYRPFSVGDHIHISGHHGHVKSIDLRYVTLTEGEGQTVLVPNAMVYQSLIQLNTK